jgi:catechol-2,3-dioxygenase
MPNAHASPPAIAGLAEVVLNVHDMARSLAFYRDLLGLEVISGDRANPVFLRAGAATDRVPALVVLVQLPPESAAFGSPRTLHHLALAVAPDAYDAAKEHRTANGFAVRTGQHPVLPSRTMYVDDPDGNEVEFIAPV